MSLLLCNHTDALSLFLILSNAFQSSEHARQNNVVSNCQQESCRCAFHAANTVSAALENDPGSTSEPFEINCAVRAVSTRDHQTNTTNTWNLL